MKTTDNVMEILKNDRKANTMLTMFHETAIAQGLSEKEYVEAREAMIGLIIANTPAAMSAMANEIWEEVNA